jgi:prophage antirepressor-like protein
MEVRRMNDIQIFNNPDFGDIRTIMIDNEPWFVGRDVAKALGYIKPENAVKTHCKHPLIQGVPHPQSKDKTINAYIIPEGDLYRLVVGSKLKSAEKFEEWIFDDVLPQLRKTGTYQLPDYSNNPMKLLELHYEAIKQVDQKVDDLSDRIDKIELDLPILPIEADRITEAVHRRGVAVLGGKDSESYHDKRIRARVYSNIYMVLKMNFRVRSYKSIKRNQCGLAISIIDHYEPPVYLADQIAAQNRQLSFC